MAKILLLTADFPPLIGGVSNYTQNIYELLKNEYEITALVLGINGKNEENIYYINAPKIFWIFYIIKFLKQKYDYIFIFNILPLGWLVNLLNVKSQKIFFIYGQELLAKRNYKIRPNVNNILKRANKIISISHYTSQLIPYKSEIFYPLIKEKKIGIKKIEKEGFILGSIGRIVEHKNFISIIKNISYIDEKVFNKTGKHVKYLIAGEGPLLEKYEKYVKKNKLENLVEFKNKINEKQKEEFFSYIDLLIMPSIQTKSGIEGFGIVPQEAGMYYVPTIGYNSGGLKESIEYGEMLVEENDEKELIEKIIELLLNPNKLEQEQIKSYNRFNKYKFSENKLKEFEKILNI